MARLTDILNGGGDELQRLWSETAAASETGPLPAGHYQATVVAGELDQSRHGTPGYRLTFQVTAPPEAAGRLFWHDCWLTPAALPQSKRDLSKLGVSSLEQLEQPLPPGICVKAHLTLRRDDDGNERNRLRGFEVTGFEPPVADPFAPAEGGTADD
jgi:hypothetical protein